MRNPTLNLGRQETLDVSECIPTIGHSPAYGEDLALPVTELQGDDGDVVDGSVGMRAKHVEAELCKQRLQIIRRRSWADFRTKALLHSAL